MPQRPHLPRCQDDGDRRRQHSCLPTADGPQASCRTFPRPDHQPPPLQQAPPHLGGRGHRQGPRRKPRRGCGQPALRQHPRAPRLPGGQQAAPRHRCSAARSTFDLNYRTGPNLPGRPKLPDLFLQWKNAFCDVLTELFGLSEERIVTFWLQACLVSKGLPSGFAWVCP